MVLLSLTVDNKGRVTLPRDIRELLGIEPGDQIVAKVENGRVSMASRESIQERLWALTLDAMSVDVPDTVETAEVEASLLASRERPRGDASTALGQETLRALGVTE